MNPNQRNLDEIIFTVSDLERILRADCRTSFGVDDAPNLDCSEPTPISPEKALR